MARSAVTITELTQNADNTLTADAFDSSNNHSIDVSDVSCVDLKVIIETLDTVAAQFDIKAGDGQAADQGDLTISTVAAGKHTLSLDSARFKDNDGLILIDITSTGATGNIYALV